MNTNAIVKVYSQLLGCPPINMIEEWLKEMNTHITLYADLLPFSGIFKNN